MIFAKIMRYTSFFLLITSVTLRAQEESKTKYVFSIERSFIHLHGKDDQVDEYFVINAHNRLALTVGIYFPVDYVDHTGLELRYENFSTTINHWDGTLAAGKLQGWKFDLCFCYHNRYHFSGKIFIDTFLKGFSVSLNGGSVNVNPDIYYINDETAYLVKEIDYKTFFGWSLFSYGAYFTITDNILIGGEITFLEFETPKIIFNTFVPEESGFVEKVSASNMFPIRIGLRIFIP